MLRGLLGINFVDSEIVLKPMIPEEWEYFMVDNLYMGNRHISIYYDKYGEHYRLGRGITVK